MKKLTFVFMVCFLMYGSVTFSAQYRAVDLGSLGGSMSSVSNINNNGAITGLTQNNNSEWRAYVWENGVMTDIGLETDIYYSAVHGINESGSIAGGRKLISSNQEVAFIRVGTTITDINGDSGSSAWTWAYDINNNNQVTGYEITPTERLAMIYHNGSITYIANTLGGQRAESKAINDAGHVVGFAFDSANSHDTKRAFYYDGTTMHILSTLGGSYSTALDINEKEEIVGEALDSNGDAHAFLYADSVMIDIGTLGGDFSRARAINEFSQIVGQSEFDMTDALHAYLYENGQMFDLNELLDMDSQDITLTIATDINDLGQIVALGYYNSDPMTQRSFLLNPVPEPLTVILLGLSVLKLLIRRK